MSILNLQRLKKKIEALKCKEHNESPTVKIESGNLKISCCCNSLDKKVQEIIDKDIEGGVDDLVGKLFN